MKIGFIGCGNMARPIIKNSAEKIFGADNTYVFDINAEILQEFCEKTGVHALQSEEQVIRTCDIVLLCIKPQGFHDLLTAQADVINGFSPFLISIAAGKETSSIGAYLAEGIRIGRIFPNLNANVGQAVSAYCVNENCTDAEREMIRQICESFGKAVDYPESMFSQFGVLGGCSPAYTFLYIDSLAKAAEHQGMEYDTALQIAGQAVLGSAMFLLQSGTNVKTLIDRVCSKGGTTIEGVNSLLKADFPAVIDTAFAASYRRDLEMKQNK